MRQSYREKGRSVLCLESEKRLLVGADGDRNNASLGRCGSYELLVELAAGGMATVFLARKAEVANAHLVAVKRPHRHLQNDKGFLTMLVDEARLASSIDHDNVVKVRELGFDGGEPFIVMDYVEGSSLADIRKELSAVGRAIDPRFAVRMALDSLAGLQAAHVLHDDKGRHLGIVHRDVSPHNVLIGCDGLARITDFGIARVVERDQAVIRQVYIGMGAVAYMAPELFTDPMGSGPQTDIYALGIIFYELLTRKLPGRRSPMPSTVNPVLPKAFDDIFDRMTRDERAERFTSADEILEEIYKADGIDKFLEPRSAVLFAKSPLSDLKFKEPPPKDPDMPVDPTAFSQAPGAAAPPGGMVGNVPTGTQSGLGTTSPSAGTGVRHATGSTRRPLTYSSRLRDRGSE